MSILDLALIGWGLLLATFVGIVLHGNHKYRAAREFNNHYVGVMAILRQPHCTQCWQTVDGPEAEHICERA